MNKLSAVTAALVAIFSAPAFAGDSSTTGQPKLSPMRASAGNAAIALQRESVHDNPSIVVLIGSELDTVTAGYGYVNYYIPVAHPRIRWTGSW